MAISAIVFDLDGTLLDTAGIQALRDARDWKGCIAHADRTRLFPGIKETLAALKEREYKLAMCTSSVSYYAHRLLAHHQVDIFDTVVAYHETARRKPAPDPILAALKRLAINPEHAVGVGDQGIDAAALTAAGVPALGAGWSPSLDRSAGWTRILREPAELLSVLRRTLGAG
jgi:phosphoglycolate phosphatase-like HAD superfamily hydrolase